MCRRQARRHASCVGWTWRLRRGGELRTVSISGYCCSACMQLCSISMCTSTRRVIDAALDGCRCDNEGHVIKGLGSWPGFGWFEALRVYGPCPEAQKKGIAYTR